MKVRKVKITRRAATTTLSIGVLIAALLLPLPDFLDTLLTSGAVGGIVWGIVDVLTEVRPTLTGDQRYMWALGLALVLPPLAYAAQIALHYKPFTYEGLWAAVGVAFATASTFHRTAERTERAHLEKVVNERMASYVPPYPLPKPPVPTYTLGKDNVPPKSTARGEDV